MAGIPGSTLWGSAAQLVAIVGNNGGGTYTSTTINDGSQSVERTFQVGHTDTGSTYSETQTINGTGSLELSMGSMQEPYTLTVTNVWQNYQWEEAATYAVEQEAVEVLRSRGQVAGKVKVEQVAVEVLRQNNPVSSTKAGTGGFIPFIHL